MLYATQISMADLRWPREVWKRKSCAFMKVAIVALVLMVVAVLLLAIGDAFNPVGLGGFTSGQGALILLLICIPVSLALFFLLAHLQNVRVKDKKREETGE